jgi:hypothetical protein
MAGLEGASCVIARLGSSGWATRFCETSSGAGIRIKVT